MYKSKSLCYEAFLFCKFWCFKSAIQLDNILKYDDVFIWNYWAVLLSSILRLHNRAQFREFRMPKKVYFLEFCFRILVCGYIKLFVNLCLPIGIDILRKFHGHIWSGVRDKIWLHPTPRCYESVKKSRRRWRVLKIRLLLTKKTWSMLFLSQ